MSIQNNLPTYAGLFGNIDFKTGYELRTVYSPAAYLTDLLQMLDDEFDSTTLDLDSRRGDIKNIDLDEENTTTLIPYLDIVIEVLEGRIKEDISSTNTSDVYAQLEEAVDPRAIGFKLNQ